VHEYVLNKKMCRVSGHLKSVLKEAVILKKLKNGRIISMTRDFTRRTYSTFYTKTGSPKLFASVLFIIAATYVIYLATSLFSSINTGLEWGIIDTLFIPAL
jgi:hypothetical protein